MLTPKRQRRRRRRLLQLLVEDVLLHRRPAGAAIFLRPVRHRPALLVQDARPVDELILAGVAALVQLLANCRRQILVEESADLVAKLKFLVGEAQVHGVSSRGSFS